MVDQWTLYSALGKWHKVGKTAKFRFYIRENDAGELWLFADYQVDGVTSRQHKLLPREQEKLAFRLANRTALEIDRDTLADLEGGFWIGETAMKWLADREERYKLGFYHNLLESCASVADAEAAIATAVDDCAAAWLEVIPLLLQQALELETENEHENPHDERQDFD